MRNWNICTWIGTYLLGHVTYVLVFVTYVLVFVTYVLGFVTYVLGFVTYVLGFETLRLFGPFMNYWEMAVRFYIIYLVHPILRMLGIEKQGQLKVTSEIPGTGLHHNKPFTSSRTVWMFDLKATAPVNPIPTNWLTLEAALYFPILSETVNGQQLALHKGSSIFL